MKKLKIAYKRKFGFRLGEAVIKIRSKENFSVIKKNWIVVRRYKAPKLWYENWYEIECNKCGSIIKYPETGNMGYIFGECEDKHKHYG